MKSFCSISAPLLVLTLTLLGHSPLGAATSSIKKICEISVNDSGFYDTETDKFCEKTLESATVDGKDDVEPLALTEAAMKVAKETLTKNLEKIEELQEKKDLESTYKKTMEYCSKVYSHGLTKMEQASVRFGFKDYDGVSVYLSNARDQVMSCVDAERVAVVKTLLEEENGRAMVLCSAAIHSAATLI